MNADRMPLPQQSAQGGWGFGSAAAVLGITVATLTVYYPSLRGGFFWDDYSLVGAPWLTASLGELWRYPPSETLALEEHYWPVTYSVFWGLHKIAGLDPFVFRLLNLALHIGNSLLVWQLARRLNVRGAALAAGWFAVHPVHVESVAWIIELKDVLSGFFFLTGALVFAGAGKPPAGGDEVSARRWAGVAVCYTLAMMSKSVAVSFPVVLGIMLWWRRATVSRRQLVALGGLGMIGVAYLAADMAVTASRSHAAVVIPLPHRIELVGRAFFWYATRLVWPDPLLAVYPKWVLGTSGLLGYVPVGLMLLGFAAGIAGLWWCGRDSLASRLGESKGVATPSSTGVASRGLMDAVDRRALCLAVRSAVAAAAAYVVLLAPTLGLVAHSYMQHAFVADRYQYLASVPATMFMAGVVAWAWLRWQEIRWLRLLLAGGVSVMTAWHASLTLVHASRYGRPELLLRHTLAFNPEHANLHTMLGALLAAQGQLEEATAAMRRAWELDRAAPETGGNLGLLLLRQGYWQQALEVTSATLERTPDHALSWGVRAAALYRGGQTTAALEAARQALARNPKQPLAVEIMDKATSPGARGTPARR